MSEWIKLPNGRFINLAWWSDMYVDRDKEGLVCTLSTPSGMETLRITDDNADALLRYLEEHAKFLGRD